MTISDIINRKIFRAHIVAFVCGLAFAALMFLPGGVRPFYLPFIPFAGFGGAILYVNFFVKCPRCAAPLGTISLNLRGPFSSGKARLNFCPNCGVSLKEPA